MMMMMMMMMVVVVVVVVIMMMIFVYSPSLVFALKAAGEPLKVLAHALLEYA